MDRHSVNFTYTKGLQLGVVRKKLGVVQKFNVVRTRKPASDHDQLRTTPSFMHMQRIYKKIIILEFKVFSK